MNLIRAVTLSEKKISKSEASTPDEMVSVEFSETVMVATVEEVAIFSATEKEDEDVNEGGVVSDPAATVATSL